MTPYNTLVEFSIDEKLTNDYTLEEGIVSFAGMLKTGIDMALKDTGLITNQIGTVTFDIISFDLEPCYTANKAKAKVIFRGQCFDNGVVVTRGSYLVKAATLFVEKIRQSCPLIAAVINFRVAPFGKDLYTKKIHTITPKFLSL